MDVTGNNSYWVSDAPSVLWPVQGNTPQALALARGIQQKLQELAARCQQTIVNTERSDQQRPAHTLAGKVEQTQHWLANPTVDDKGLG